MPFSWVLEALAIFGLQMYPPNLYPHHHIFPSMSQISFCLLLFGPQLLCFIVVVQSWSPVQFFVFRATRNPELSHFKILKLITSTKTLPTDKFTFTLPGIKIWTYLLGEGLYSKHYLPPTKLVPPSPASLWGPDPHCQLPTTRLQPQGAEEYHRHRSKQTSIIFFYL